MELEVALLVERKSVLGVSGIAVQFEAAVHRLGSTCRR